MAAVTFFRDLLPRCSPRKRENVFLQDAFRVYYSFTAARANQLNTLKRSSNLFPKVCKNPFV